MTDTPAQRLPAPTPGSLHELEPLLPAELAVLRAAARGDIAKLGYRRPRAPAPDVRLRAAFLALLAGGGDANAPVDGRRLQVMGACVTGRLDLTGATLPMSLWFYRCTFGAAPLLAGARVCGSLSFVDCALPGLRAEGCRVEAELALRAGCTIDGPLDLARVCVGGDVDLRGGIESIGEMRFVGARIGGDLLAGGARLTADIDPTGVRGVALNLDRAHLGGSVVLDAGVSAAGTVRLVRARIGGDLDCRGAAFDTVGDASWGACGSALRLDGARIEGALILQDLPEPLQAASLVDTHVGTLTDDAGSWGRDHVLDGFDYTRFGPGAPTDAPSRLAWLAQQEPAHVEADFRPDPWRRAIRVLRRGGHHAAAGALAIGREHHLRRIGRVGRSVPRALRWLPRLGHFAWGVLAGYGHRPLRLLWAAVVVWILRGVVYCAAGVPALQAFADSLDFLLPLADTHEHAQNPFTALPSLQRLIGVEAACGWVLGAMWLASLFGLADRDRRIA